VNVRLSRTVRNGAIFGNRSAHLTGVAFESLGGHSNAEILLGGINSHNETLASVSFRIPREDVRRVAQGLLEFADQQGLP